MSNTLHYRGRVELSMYELMGPDLHGSYYRPKSWDYDEETDTTTVTFTPGSAEKHREDILNGN